MAVTWMKYKYRAYKPAQQGYSPGGSSDSTKRKPNYKKATDAQKRVITASQRKKVLVYDALRGKGRFVDAE